MCVCVCGGGLYSQEVLQNLTKYDSNDERHLVSNKLLSLYYTILNTVVHTVLYDIEKIQHNHPIHFFYCSHNAQKSIHYLITYTVL